MLCFWKNASNWRLKETPHRVARSKRYIHSLRSRRASELVGVTRWCPDVAPVKHLPRFGDCWKIESVPQILKLKPDLVIGSVPFKAETLANSLRTLFDFLRSIREASWTSNPTFASSRDSSAGNLPLHSSSQDAPFVHKDSSKTRGKRALRVYSEAWPNPRIASPPWVAELVAIAGGEMVVPAGQRISGEQIAQANQT